MATVRFIGTVDFSDGVWLGVELKTPSKSSNDLNINNIIGLISLKKIRSVDFCVCVRAPGKHFVYFLGSVSQGSYKTRDREFQILSNSSHSDPHFPSIWQASGIDIFTGTGLGRSLGLGVWPNLDASMTQPVDMHLSRTCSDDCTTMRTLKGMPFVHEQIYSP